jgi:ribokinase
MTIHIFGSLNMDLVCQTPHLPVPGETVLGTGFATVPGGKGANQAIAAARLGGSVAMVGRVGRDRFGEQLRSGLLADGVNADGVRMAQDTTSGVAAIAVDSQGQNHIIVVPGANGQVDKTDVAHLESQIQPGDILLLQLEVPLPAVLAAAQTAKARGATVVLDPAPAPATLPETLYRSLDLITPNEVEAAQLVGFTVHDAQTAAAAASVLRQRGVGAVVVKLGERGVYFQGDQVELVRPAYVVKAVDTVAAGDAFNGGLAVAIAAHYPWPQALAMASATAALSVTQAGAQPSMPTRQQVETFLSQQASTLPDTHPQH